MDFQNLINKAKQVQQVYKRINEQKGQKLWDASAYTQGLVGDVGDLMKLIMAKENFRHAENIDKALSRELSDCLWAILIISSELGIDLEKEFIFNMDELEKKITTE